MTAAKAKAAKKPAAKKSALKKTVKKTTAAKSAAKAPTGKTKRKPPRPSSLANLPPGLKKYWAAQGVK